MRRTLRRHAMLAGGERVLVAVSGGADSVALLHALRGLADEWRLVLHVLHVDHGLRPDAPRDADFVRALAQRFGVPVEVATVAVERRGSLEAAARAARYAALEACADRIGAARIAVGHTADDQAETVLMRLLEGAGIRGLAGIPPIRGRVIRPLIALRRTDVVAELTAAGLEWRDDHSNRDPKFLRNRIRHELLPLLSASYQPAIVGTLDRIASLAREATDALDAVAAAELERLAVADGADALTLPLAALRRLPRPVAAQVLGSAAARFGGAAPFRAWAYRGLRRVLASPPPRRPFRLGGVTIEVSAGRLRVGVQPAPALLARAVPVPGRVALPEIGVALETRVVDAVGYHVGGDSHRVAFDADAVAGPLAVRGRRRGDRFTPFGATGERRLKTFLIDARLPRWERDRLPLVEAGGEIVWLGGLRRAAAAPVTATTRRVLEMALLPLAGDGAR